MSERKLDKYRIVYVELYDGYAKVEKTHYTVEELIEGTYKKFLRKPKVEEFWSKCSYREWTNSEFGGYHRIIYNSFETPQEAREFIDRLKAGKLPMTQSESVIEEI